MKFKTRFINRLLSFATLAFTFLTVSSYAGDITIGSGATSLIDDHNNDSIGRNYKYEIDKMTVQWDDDDQITVDVFTRFGNDNNDNTMGDRRIIFGDLLIGTNGAGANYNYAFSLGSLLADSNLEQYYHNNLVNGFQRYHDFSSSDNLTFNNVGGLHQISGTTSSATYHNKTSGNGSLIGPVFGDLQGGAIAQNKSSWSIDNTAYWDILSFTFNVSSINAFKNASQLSLSWAMSCFNDDVAGTLAINRPDTPIPEPSTFILFLLALTGLSYRKRSDI